MAYFVRKKIATDGLVFCVDAANRVSSIQTDNSAAEFDNAVAHELSISSDTELNNLPTNDFTISTWAKIDVKGGTRVLLSKLAPLDNSFYLFHTDSTDQLIFGASTNGGTSINASVATGGINVGQWYHISVTFNLASNTAKMYIDGVLKNTNTSFGPGLHTSNAPLRVGSFDGTASSSWHGAVDNMSIYTRELDLAEVQALYNGGAGQRIDDADKTGLLSWWSFSEQGINDDRLDAWGGKHLTASGGVSAVPGIVQSPETFLHTKNLVNVSQKGSPTNGVLKVDDAFVFDGVEGYIDFGDLSSINNAVNGATTSSEFTVQCWVKPNLLSFGDILGKGASTSNFSFAIELFATGQLIWAISDGIGNQIQIRSSSNLVADVWQQVTCIKRLGTSYNSIDMYLNGVLLPKINFADTSPATIGTTSPFKVGGALGFFYGGIISNAQIYNRALTPTEILSNYNAQKLRFI